MSAKTPSTKKAKIRLLIVDDHPVVRKGLQSCLSVHERLEIVGEAADGNEAISKARELSPDVILMDINMPNMNGFEVMELLRENVPNAKVLALSMYNRREYIVRIIQSGARGYMLKDATPQELASAVESVYGGETVFGSGVSRDALDQNGSGVGGNQLQAVSKLTDREREVLALIVGEQSNKEIADRLGVGVRTVETHRERIMRKLDIHSVVELTKFAIANGIIKL